MRIEQTDSQSPDTTDQLEYCMKHEETIIGYFSLCFESEKIVKLTQLSMTRKTPSTDLLDVLGHIMLFAETLSVRLLMIETDNPSLVTILEWFGFRADDNRPNTWGYLCG